jgi:hypothetical protein
MVVVLESASMGAGVKGLDGMGVVLDKLYVCEVPRHVWSAQEWIKECTDQLQQQNLDVYCKVEIKRFLKWCGMLFLVVYKRSNGMNRRSGHNTIVTIVANPAYPQYFKT